MKIKTVTLMLTVPLVLTSCFSTYPIQKKTPCSETTLAEKLEAIEQAYNYREKPANLIVNEAGVQNGKRSYEFDNIRYVKVRRQAGPLWIYTKWNLQIKEDNGDVNFIYCRDQGPIVKANNALMCLTYTYATNGRPPRVMPVPNAAPALNKYDALEKLKKLLDSGAITQEEYEIEKRKILNM